MGAGGGGGGVLPRAVCARARSLPRAEWPPPCATRAIWRTSCGGPSSPLPTFRRSPPPPRGSRCSCLADAAARAEGADHVAAALAAPPGVQVVRNGSRGMLWLEPLVEVATPEGRVAYGPVEPADVPGLLAAGALQGGDHPLRLGPVDDLPWMKAQQRVTFARVGVIDPRDAADYEVHGGLAGLRRALAMTPADVVAEVTASGLRGRGGAAFPTGIKWQTVLDAPGCDEVHRVQRRRGRQRHVRRPHADGGRPVHPARGHGHRRLGGRRERRATSTSAASTPMPSPHWRPPRPRLAPPALSVRTCSGVGLRSTCTCASAPAPTSAARRRRCWRASKAGAEWCGPSRRCRRSKACSASRRSSTTCSAWPPCRRSSPTAPRPTPRSAPGAAAAPRCSSSPATSPAAASWRPRSASPSASSSRGSVAAASAAAPSALSRSVARSAPTCPPTSFDLPADYEAFAAADAPGRPRRHRRVRRHRRHGGAGPLRDGVLRRRELRQVHPLPHRQHTWASR